MFSNMMMPMAQQESGGDYQRKLAQLLMQQAQPQAAQGAGGGRLQSQTGAAPWANLLRTAVGAAGSMGVFQPHSQPGMLPGMNMPAGGAQGMGGLKMPNFGGGYGG